MTQEAAPASPQGAQAAAVSNGIVGLFRKHYGRGPVKAKTFIMDEYVCTILHETLTPSERTLVADGKEEMVRDFRLAFQTAMAEEFKGVVEESTGREVRSYQSQIAFHPEVCFEFFWLDDAPDQPD